MHPLTLALLALAGTAFAAVSVLVAAGPNRGPLAHGYTAAAVALVVGAFTGALAWQAHVDSTSQYGPVPYVNYWDPRPVHDVSALPAAGSHPK